MVPIEIKCNKKTCASDCQFLEKHFGVGNSVWPDNTVEYSCSLFVSDFSNKAIRCKECLEAKEV